MIHSFSFFSTGFKISKQFKNFPIIFSNYTDMKTFAWAYGNFSTHKVEKVCWKLVDRFLCISKSAIKTQFPHLFHFMLFWKQTKTWKTISKRFSFVQFFIKSSSSFSLYFYSFSSRLSRISSFSSMFFFLLILQWIVTWQCLLMKGPENLLKKENFVSCFMEKSKLKSLSTQLFDEEFA